MPKKLFFTRVKFEAKDVIMTCEFCNYNSTSITAMKLHRKVKHGITNSYNLERSHVKFCVGCKKEIKQCFCTK